jgi:hypothetical protein
VKILNSLTANNFEGYEKEAHFLYDFYSRYGKLPDYGTFKSEFPAFRKLKAPESSDFYFEEIKKRILNEIHRTHSGRVFNSIRASSDAAEVAALINTWNDTIQNHLIGMRGGVNYSYGVDKQVERYLFRASGKGAFLEFPLPSLQNLVYRMYPEELLSIGARTGVGKSWIVCLLANHAARVQRLKTLIVSRELSGEDMVDRINAINLNLHWRKFRRGELTDKEIQQYKRGLTKLEKEQIPLKIIGSDEASFTLELIEAYAKDFSAELVLIDGMHLVDSPGKTETEKTYIKSRLFKRICRRSGIIGVQALQISKQFEDDQGRTKSSGLIGFSWGDAVTQDSDVVCEITAPAGRDSPLKEWYVAKSRNDSIGKFPFMMRLTPVEITESMVGQETIPVSLTEG